MAADPIVIVSCARTPLGSFQGSLSALTAPQLATPTMVACIEKAKIDAEKIDEVILGCVLPAGQGQAPARQASIAANIPNSTGCTTINKMCGSGMKAVMLAHDLIALGENDIMIAGGMESMTNAPYLLPKARAGLRLGHGQIIDHMFLDGLEDAYEKGQLMGAFAEATAEHYGFTRDEQDAFAIQSLTKAKEAAKANKFKDEIVPITLKSRRDEITVSQDEGPEKAKVDKIPTLRPAFKKDGTVTAANSSSISDGAATLLLMRRSKAESMGLTPLATIVAHSTHAQEPAWFTTAPTKAVEKVLTKANWQLSDVDLFEINEAFAVVTMATMKDLSLPAEKVNIYGGACALGHPIGASGARIIVTLLNALAQNNLKRGIASLCIGGGEATAMALEMEC